MRSALVRDLMRSLGNAANRSPKIGRCSESDKALIEQWNIPVGLKRLLQWDWFNEPLGDPHYIYSASDIIRANDRDLYMSAGLLQIGDCPNGDMICVDFNYEKCPVYFASHDELWSSDPPAPRSAAVKVFDSLEEFFWRLVEGKYIPVDYYAGKEYRDFLDERGG